MYIWGFDPSSWTAVHVHVYRLNMSDVECMPTTDKPQQLLNVNMHSLAIFFSVCMSVCRADIPLCMCLDVDIHRQLFLHVILDTYAIFISALLQFKLFSSLSLFLSLLVSSTYPFFTSLLLSLLSVYPSSLPIDICFYIILLVLFFCIQTNNKGWFTTVCVFSPSVQR